MQPNVIYISRTEEGRLGVVSDLQSVWSQQHGRKYEDPKKYKVGRSSWCLVFVRSMVCELVTCAEKGFNH